MSVDQPGSTSQSCARVADAAAKSRGVLHRVDILAHELGLEHAVGDIDRVAGQLPLAPAVWAAKAQFLGSQGLDGEQKTRPVSTSTGGFFPLNDRTSH